MAEVDKLQISIESSSNKAVKRIEKLTEALKNLQNQLNQEYKNPVNGLTIPAAPRSSSSSSRTRTPSRQGTQPTTPKKSDVWTSESQTKDIPSERELTSLEKKVNIMERLRSVMTSMQGLPSRLSSEFKTFASDLKSNIESIPERFKSAMQSLPQQFKSAMQSLPSTMSSAMNGLKGLPGKIIDSKAFNGVMKTVSNGIMSASNAMSTLATKAGSFATKSFISAGKAITERFISPIKNAITTFSKLKSALGRVAFYRAIRTAMKMITQGFKEGIDNLYQYSRLVGTNFAPSMDKLATSALYLKNSLGAMAAPLINALAPVVDALIDKFVTLLNVIGKVFAALTGQSVFSQAKKKVTSYGASLDKAGGSAKKLKSYLLGIDELNVFNDNAGGGGGGGAGGGGFGDMFEEVKVPTDILDWANQVRDAIKNGEWREAGEILAGKLNELLDQWDSYAWGEKLGKKINNGLNLVYGFMTTFNFEGLGSRFAGMLNGLFDTVDADLLGRTLATKINAAINAAYGFITKFNWKNFGTFIGKVINGWFDEIQWDKAGTAISKGINGVFSAVGSFLETANITQFGQDIVTLFKNLFINLDWATIGRTCGDLLTSAISLAGTMLASINWTSAVTGLFDGLRTALSNVDFKALFGSVFLWYSQQILAFFEIKEGWFSGVASTWSQAMRKIGLDGVAGLLEGIAEKAKSIGTWIKTSLVDPLVKAVKSTLGIHSPSTVFAEIGENVVAGFLQGLKDKWGDVLSFFSTKLPEWWSRYVSPWFTLEKWRTLVSSIGTSIKTEWNNTSSKWSADLTAWWNDSVSPWFTLEKWTALVASIGKSIKTEWTNTSSKWKTDLTTWWNGDVSPWFTLEKWAGMVASIGKSIKTEWDSTAGTWKTDISGWWTSHVAPWFTLEKWAGLVSSIGKSIKTEWANTVAKWATDIADWWTNKVKPWFTTGKWKALGKQALDGLFSGLSDMGNKATKWGSDLCSNLANGIRNSMSKVTSATRSLASTISGYLHFSEPDVGPLSDFHTYMPDMLKLMAQGIKDNTKLAVDAASGLADALSDRLQSVEYNVTPTYSAKPTNGPIISTGSVNLENGLNTDNQSTRENAEMNVDRLVAVCYTVCDRIVQAIESKDTTVKISGRSIMEAGDRASRERGVNIMAGGVL